MSLFFPSLWLFVGFLLGGVFRGDQRLTSVRNRGELAEGWYDPATLQKAIKSAAETNAPSRSPARRRGSPDYGSQPENDKATTESSNDDDDDIGPALPNADSKPHKHHRSGPAIPSLQDLELRRGTTRTTHLTNLDNQPKLTHSQNSSPPTPKPRTKASNTTATKPGTKLSASSTNSPPAPTPARGSDRSKRSARRPRPIGPLQRAESMRATRSKSRMRTCWAVGRRTGSGSGRGRWRGRRMRGR